MPARLHEVLRSARICVSQRRRPGASRTLSRNDNTGFRSEIRDSLSGLLRLRKPLDAQCHFLKGHGCSIHPAKPTQCRVYPFWPELVEDRKAWKEEAKSCPGIGKGELVQIGDALELSSEMKSAYPSMYP